MTPTLKLEIKPFGLIHLDNFDIVLVAKVCKLMEKWFMFIAQERLHLCILTIYFLHTVIKQVLR